MLFAMQEKDKIIDAIGNGEINSDNISFNKVRRIATTPVPPDVHNELGYGQAILTSQDQLNKYFFAYGTMIECQWGTLLNNANISSIDLEVIDYACGQGIASMLFFDNLPDAKNITSSITLIEPSKVALERSKHIMQCYIPNAKIKDINKTLDNISPTDFHLSSESVKIHLFSNILDMNEFSISELFKKIILLKGKNFFIAVSSDRASYGGRERLDEFYNLFKKNEKSYTMKKLETESFVVKNPSSHSEAKDFNVRYVFIEIKV
jgi:hypothetical protein